MSELIPPSVRNSALIALFALGALQVSNAQIFDSGSDGSFGEIHVLANQSVSLPVPPDGVFNCTSITVEANGLLSFERNALNTPVYLLATGEIVIRGRVDVSGGPGTQNPATGGLGGPGGFAGGAPGIADGVLGGAGFGPGGGRRGSGGLSGGHGSYGGRGFEDINHVTAGDVYGSQLLQPMVGGSGGGGGAGRNTSDAGFGGGGGGGAVLLASNAAVRIIWQNGNNEAGIWAAGGSVNWQNRDQQGGGGSGGAIRIVAPIVQLTGNFHRLDTLGGVGFQNTRAGVGRIRIDTIDRSQIQFVQSFGVTTVGSFMVARIPDLPTLDVIECADVQIPLGYPTPVYIALPFGSTNARLVKVRAAGFSGIVPARCVLTPNNGDPINVDFDIDASGGQPVEVTVPILVPASAVTSVNVWTR